MSDAVNWEDARILLSGLISDKCSVRVFVATGSRSISSLFTGTVESFESGALTIAGKSAPDVLVVTGMDSSWLASWGDERVLDSFSLREGFRGKYESALTFKSPLGAMISLLKLKESLSDE